MLRDDVRGPVGRCSPAQKKCDWGVRATSGVAASEEDEGARVRREQRLQPFFSRTPTFPPRKRCLFKYLKMMLILLGVLILHLIILILLIVSTAASAWTVGGNVSKDLWYNCQANDVIYQCTPASDEDWIQAVQALMILAVLFCFFSLVAFIFQLFKLVKGGRFFFTAIFQILASLFVMCGAIIYTVMRTDDLPGAQFGYAYVLAWVAFPLCLISGLIYIVLRKKE